ncbi:MAG: hypothetical protein EA426_10525 [Spirochaetaceae bacterium]|nr:MAG: hypothetical protein EA426_10525 [Spirochaetaceae bacterium]
MTRPATGSIIPAPYCSGGSIGRAVETIASRICAGVNSGCADLSSAAREAWRTRSLWLLLRVQHPAQRFFEGILGQFVD